MPRRAYAAAMTSRRNHASGGIFIFLGTLIGLFIGASNGALALGMFAGFAAGLAIAALIWLSDRWRD